MSKPIPWTRERFMSRIRVVGECWEWARARHPGGYGATCYNGKQTKAHRLAYLLFVGPLPDGAWVLHSCDNPPCCNPAHLYAGTATDNNRDTVRRQRRAMPVLHCKRGHEFTPENTMVAWKAAGIPSGRRCRVCTYMLNNQSRERQRQRNPAEAA